MDRILAGVAEFQRSVFPSQRGLFEDLAHQQQPRALFIACADSRVLPNLITQTEPGELFLCRHVGNIVPAHGAPVGGVSATIEYAVSSLQVRHVIVCGHSDCGAMRLLLDPTPVAHLPAVVGWLNHADAARRLALESSAAGDADALLDSVTRHNVVSMLDNLRTHPAVALGLYTGRLEVHGWMYRIETGEVEVWEPLERRFVSAGALMDPSAGDGEARHLAR